MVLEIGAALGGSLLCIPYLAAADEEVEALFAAGDARFLQAIFETKRDSGIISTTIGLLSDGTRALRVTYNPSKCSYKVLLGTFWRNVDPTDGQGQFKDRGSEFRPVIFVRNEEERTLAEKSQKLLVESGIYGQGAPRTIVPFAVEIIDGDTGALVSTRNR